MYIDIFAALPQRIFEMTFGGTELEDGVK